MRTLLLFLSIICFFGCRKETQSSQFVGDWKGSYSSSSDYGTFTMNIRSDGKVTGTAVSSSSFPFELEGNVGTTGQIALSSGSTTVGAIFEGRLIGTTGSGTWKNNLDKGTWTAYRP